MFPPPHHGTVASKAYKSHINAHPARIENDFTAYSPQTHENNAQVQLLVEMMIAHNDEAVCLSCDNKDMVSLCQSAVDRHIQSKKFYMEEQLPHTERYFLIMAKILTPL